MSDNLKLWKEVEKTDPSATKNLGQTGRTSIDAYYTFHKATKTFGPCGIGWGYEIIEERFDSGDIIDVESQITSLTHTILLKLWYILDGKKGEISQFGHTKYRYLAKPKNSDPYIFIDEEAPKKSITDAITKCLSMIGFSADIYMKKFDDPGYVDELRTVEAINKAENKIEAEIAEHIKFREEFTKVILQIQEAATYNVVKGLYAVMRKKIERRLDRDPKAKDLLTTLNDTCVEATEKFKTDEEQKND